MKKIGIIFQALLFFLPIVSLCGCSGESNEETWDEMPEKISSFLIQYFPGECQSFDKLSNGEYVAKMKNSVTVIFNSECQWISVNGNGGTISSYFLYDCLNEKLYNYIDGLGMLDNVYKVFIDKGIYYVELLDTDIEYDSMTGTITET